MAHAQSKQILILGLDGATFTLLDKWIDEGRLPNLRKIIAGGASGKLRSTLPPLTGPAWTSFMTGTNPGIHGIYDFIVTEEWGYGRKPINSTLNHAPTLWSLLSAQDKRLVVMNVPGTYPPQAVNGVLISGMLTPATASSFIYPPELHKAFLERYPGYEIDTLWQNYEGSELELLEQLSVSTKNRMDAFVDLLQEKPWDLSMLVITGTDRIHHCLWSYIDPETAVLDTMQRKGIRQKIDAYYDLIDGFIGKLVDIAGSDATILLVSDHGFGRLDKDVYLSYFLREWGYLTLRQSRRDAVRYLVRLLNRLGLSKEKMRLLLRNLGLKRETTQKLDSFGRVSGAVNWRLTRAFISTRRGIRINLVGREPQGIVNPGSDYEDICGELKHRLLDITDPATGAQIVKDVYRAEDVYSGPQLLYAPDLVIDLGDGPYEAPLTRHDVPQPFGTSDWSTGGHRMDGIFIANGPDILPGKTVCGTRIQDVTPLLLHLYGLPIPEYMDGRVPEDILKNDSPIQYTTDETYYAYKGTGSHNPLPTADQDVIETRLKGLGYLE